MGEDHREQEKTETHHLVIPRYIGKGMYKSVVVKLIDSEPCSELPVLLDDTCVEAKYT